jgi:hypothetical protein
MTLYHVSNAEVMMAEQMETNRVEALVITPEDFMSILQDKAKASPAAAQAILKALQGSVFAQYWKQEFYPNVNQPAVIPVGQAGADIATLRKAFSALGVIGTESYTKTVNGRAYFILKGRPGLRNTLTGTRFLLTNPKIVQLGLGAQGLKHVAKGGFILGLVVTTGFEVADYILNDEKTMMDLVGSIGYEAVKSGVVVGLAYGAGLLAGAMSSVAVVPMVGMFVMALAFGYGLNKLDSQFDVKSKVLKTFKALPAKLEQGVYQLQQDGLPTLEQIKRAADQQLSRATNAANNAVDKAIDKTIDAAVDQVLNELSAAIKRILGPRVR